MALENHDPETIRRYLLSQLTDDEQAATEERLLHDDDFFEELEITKDELIEEYLANQLAPEERAAFNQSFLASPEGKQRRAFSKTLNRYILDNRPPHPKEQTWSERFFAFWNRQPGLLRTATAVAAVVIVVGLFWLARPPSPQSLAVTLDSSSVTRSNGPRWKRVEAGRDLIVTLNLPAPAPSGARYRLELDNVETEAGVTNLNIIGQDAKSVTTDIPAARLGRGRYTINLYISKDGDTGQKPPVSYQFEVE